ncbi:MAG: hypothetical protein RL693_617 [Verrucomicrobiota bacterium]|jgi:hypothetical protein
MKLTAIILCFLTLLTSLPASEKFTVSAAGVSITFPDGWQHDAEDTFGFVIQPPTQNTKPKRVRIHMTAHQGITLEAAIQKGFNRGNELREKNKHPPEKLIRSTPVTTRSGIKGQKATIGDESANGNAYLNRYYFLKLDGSIFCVCVYYYGDAVFEKQVEESIFESLAFTE